MTALALQAALVVSGVIAARLLGPTYRGYLALLVAIPSVLAQLGGLGLSLAASYFIARDPAAVRGIFSRLRGPIVLQVITLVVAHGIAVALYLPEKPRDVQFAGMASLLIIPGALLLEYGLASLQGQRRFRAFNALRLAPPALYALCLVTIATLSISAVMVFVLLAVLSTIAAGLVATEVGIRRVPVADPARVAVPERRELFDFGVRSWLGYTSPTDAFRLDQLVVGLFVSPYALGLYAVSAAFTNLPRFMAQSVGFVATPELAAERDPSRLEARLWRFFATGLAVAACVAVVLALAAEVIVSLLFGSAFAGAVPIARILLLASVFLAGRRILADGARGAGYPLAGAIGEAMGLVFLLPLLVVLTPRWGADGVAWAFVIAAAVSMVGLMIAVRQLLRNGSRAVADRTEAIIV